MSRRSILLAAVLLPLLPGTAHAQARPQTPDAVALAFLAAADSGEWARAASLVHPESLAKFKGAFTEVAAAAAKAEAGGGLQGLFGVRNMNEFEALAPAALFERVMKRLEEFRSNRGAGQSLVVVGQVAEAGTSIVHVILRSAGPGEKSADEDVKVSTVKRDGDRWGALFTDSETLAEMFLAFVIAANASAVPDGASQFRNTAEKAYLASQRADLRNLAAMQEIFRGSDNDGDGQPDQVYAASLEQLSFWASKNGWSLFLVSPGVSLTLLEAGAEGWAATSQHQALPGRGCVMYQGVVSAPPRTPGGRSASSPGEVVCDPASD